MQKIDHTHTYFTSTPKTEHIHRHRERYTPPTPCHLISFPWLEKKDYLPTEAWRWGARGWSEARFTCC